MVTAEQEQKARTVAIWIIVLMTIIWIALSFMSFVDSGDRVRPQTENISFQGVTALKGKQVFQSYNCMDCHTIVGNGAYFAPDLTKLYDTTGPAWLKAYLGSPATYPTKAIVNIQLQQMAGDKELGLPSDIDAYLDKYPGAKSRVEQRGGVDAMMPTLPFTAEEIDALIAYFKYTNMINTAGWPPEVIADEAIIRAESRKLEEKSGLYRNVPTASADADGEADGGGADGFAVAQTYACVACHSADGSTLVGPSFKGLFGSVVELDDGSSVTADEAYLTESILQPNASIVKGFSPGLMPSFNGIISEQELAEVIEYIKSLN